MSKRARSYQTEASRAIIAAWANHKSCMATVATGGGKTLIAADTAAAVKDKGRVLFLANRNELCMQPLGVFREQTGIMPGLEKAEYQAPLESRIVVASVQTMTRKNRLSRFPQNHFSFIFADEAHMSAAESWKRIFNYFPEAKLCGITATPFRSDAKKLTDIFEVEAYRKELLSLVDDGWLVNPDNVDQLSTAISLADVRIKKTVEGVDYDLNDAADAIAPYFDEIAKELRQNHAEKHILAFLPLIASSQKFVAACVRAGLNAVHIDGDDPERDQKLRAFKDGQITLLSNSNLLHTGVDMPVCNATLNLRPTKSKVLYCQIVGRSTRTVPGLVDEIPTAEGRLTAIAKSAKPRAYIIDPLWMTQDHDLCTPAFLIAKDQDFAYEMHRKAGKRYSLRAVHAFVQAEREGAIARRLQNVASFREGRVDAKYFAAGTHQLSLLDYEPVYAWEKEPARNISRRLLQDRGIDPDSVKSEGEAREVIRAINVRRFKGLAEIRLLGDAADRGWPLEELWTLKPGDVRALTKHAFAK